MRCQGLQQSTLTAHGTAIHILFDLKLTRRHLPETLGCVMQSRENDAARLSLRHRRLRPVVINVLPVMPHPGASRRSYSHVRVSARELQAQLCWIEHIFVAIGYVRGSILILLTADFTYCSLSYSGVTRMIKERNVLGQSAFNLFCFSSRNMMINISAWSW